MSEIKPCPCTIFEQDEDCPEGYPSMLCGICHGTGNAPEDQITALAVEMIKIASDVGEPEDPFAAWESVSLITAERDRLREALKEIIRKDDTGPMVYELRENGPSQAIGGSEGIFAAIARAALKGDE